MTKKWLKVTGTIRSKPGLEWWIGGLKVEKENGYEITVEVNKKELPIDLERIQSALDNGKKVRALVNMPSRKKNEVLTVQIGSGSITEQLGVI